LEGSLRHAAPFIERACRPLTVRSNLAQLALSISFYQGRGARLETIEARIEVFSRRMDDEVEQRHKLAERLSTLSALSKRTRPALLKS
jgi:hypothetical protein